MGNDIERETGLNRDAGEMIERLEWEARELSKAAEGHDDKLAEAAEVAREAASILQNREDHLSQETEDTARLVARHQSAQRLVEDSHKTLARSEGEEEKARAAVE